MSAEALYIIPECAILLKHLKCLCAGIEQSEPFDAVLSVEALLEGSVYAGRARRHHFAHPVWGQGEVSILECQYLRRCCLWLMTRCARV